MEEIEKQESVRECEHVVAKNSPDCISGFMGHKLIGVLFSAEYLGAITMIFDCGAGLTITCIGTYWTEFPASIKSMVQRKQKELAKTQMEIEGVLELGRE